MKNILIIDDNQGILYMFEYNLLDYPDYQVIKAQDLVQAMEVIDNNDIDLIVLDIRMGEHNGMHFWDELKRRNKVVKTIIITGCEPHHESALYAEKEGLKVFYKPFKVDIVIEYIRNVL